MGVRGASGASAVHFGANFINQKLQGAPDLKGAVTFKNPKSISRRTWAPRPSGAMVTHVEFVQQKLLGPSQNLFGLVVNPLH